MAFDARTRDEIRDSYLTDLAARYAERGKTVDVSRFSHEWMRAEALATIVSLFEYQASKLDKEILPDQASYTLNRHGEVEGMPRDAAVSAVLEVAVTGTPSATLTLTGTTMTATDGVTEYTISENADGTGTSVALDGSGNGTVYATAVEAGEDSNLPDGSILAWSSPPTGANPTGEVTDTTVDGADEESDADYAARIIARRQERPASGNRADWKDWVEAVTGVTTAVVYPLLHPTYGTDTLGAVTVLALGPVQGDSADNTRIVSGALLTTIAGYIEGDNDVDGDAVTDGTQLRPVTIKADAYTIEAATEEVEDVELTIVLASAYAAPWTYNAAYLVLASPAPTTTSFALAGDLTAVLQPGASVLSILVNVGTGDYRGGYYQVTPTSVSYNLIANKTTVSVPALPAAPPSGFAILPGLSNWSSIRTAVLDYFDSLGPGDTSPACRWPSEETTLRATLYRSALAGDVTDVAGVLSCTVTDPAANVTPAEKAIVTLGVLSAHV